LANNMGRVRRGFDKRFLVVVLVLVFTGFFIFASASLGLLTRDGATFSQVAFNQIVYGILFGMIAMLIISNIQYRFWKKYSFYIFLFSIGITLLVFIPQIGIEFGGARRWISYGSLPSFQPAELLKFGFVIYFATWLSSNRDKIHSFMYSTIPFLILLLIMAVILLFQPDTGTFIVVLSAAICMFIAAGARWRDILILGGISAVGLGLLSYMRPYIMDRILAFFNPTYDPLGISYQLQQSLIAIGSGGLWGRGFGQSVQKFNYLPEPISDSIFSVAAEEFGFVGSIFLISLFLYFALRGFYIAKRAPDYFGGLVVVGIVILIISQSFLNIASMLGVFPLTGLPLLFISHGGTALFFALAEVGVILNVSRYMRA